MNGWMYDYINKGKFHKEDIQHNLLNMEGQNLTSTFLQSHCLFPHTPQHHFSQPRFTSDFLNTPYVFHALVLGQIITPFLALHLLKQYPSLAQNCSHANFSMKLFLISPIGKDTSYSEVQSICPSFS